MTNNWTPVSSSNIEAMSYAPDARELSVQFKTGAIYMYSNVEESTVDEILTASSVGSCFNRLIKAHPLDYPYRRLN